jgi:hypothetical protein
MTVGRERHRVIEPSGAERYVDRGGHSQGTLSTAGRCGGVGARRSGGAPSPRQRRRDPVRPEAPARPTASGRDGDHRERVEQLVEPEHAGPRVGALAGVDDRPGRHTATTQTAIAMVAATEPNTSFCMRGSGSAGHRPPKALQWPMADTSSANARPPRAARPPMAQRAHHVHRWRGCSGPGADRMASADRRVVLGGTQARPCRRVPHPPRHPYCALGPITQPAHGG